MADVTRRLSDALGLPHDALGGTPRLTLEGSARLTVENHKGVLAFQPDLMKLHTASGTVLVHGENLQILWISQDDIVIGGVIGSLVYEDAPDGAASGAAPK